MAGKSVQVASLVNIIATAMFFQALLLAIAAAAPMAHAQPAECLLPVVVGPCKALIPRFAYNPATGTCESFNYGGCQGNANNFVTLEECQEACRPDVPPPRQDPCPFPVPPLDPDVDICTLPLVTGPCRAAFRKWGYKPRSGGCVEFIYGGCCGNPNRFDTQEECEEACE